MKCADERFDVQRWAGPPSRQQHWISAGQSDLSTDCELELNGLELIYAGYAVAAASLMAHFGEERSVRKQEEIKLSYESVLMEAAKKCEFVTVDSRIRGGKPCIKGTRVPVYAVLDAVGEYGTLEGAARAYGFLTVDQVRDAVHFSASLMESPLEHEPTPADRRGYRR